MHCWRSDLQVNCVDTGWVTDMAPLGQGAKSKTHQTHVGPPLDEEDGAARVLDPIFTREIRLLSTLSTLSTLSILSHTHMYLIDLAHGSTVHGVFFKDYKQSPW